MPLQLSLEDIINCTAILLILSVLISKASVKFGIPALLLFLFIGMLAGSEGLGGIRFDNFPVANGLGIIALIFILFAGGLDTHWKSIKPVLGAGISLATIGVAITGGIVCLFSYYVLQMPILLSLLLGSVVSSTDAAAVFGVLRARGLKLKGNLTPLLELESGSNDPMAVFLTIGITNLIANPKSNMWDLAPQLVIQMVVGIVGGFLIGWAALQLINRVRLDFDGLYPVLTIGVALLAFAGPEHFGGNGYLSVYVAGVTIGSKNFVHRASLIQFHDALSWLMQIAMFLCLGLLVFPSNLVPQMVPGFLVALVLIFIARPIAIFAGLAPFKFSLTDKFFLSWVGLRGAVPIILATIPVTSGIDGANLIFNQVFFIVLASVLIQGTSLGWIASYLGIIVKGPVEVRERKIATNMLEIKIPDDSPLVHRRLVDLNLPDGVLIVLLTRGREAFIPRGATVLLPADVLLISDQGVEIEALKQFFLSGRAIDPSATSSV